MTSAGFRVVPDTVSAGAGVLDDAGSAVAGMRPSAAELDSGAYGVVGAFFAADATAAMRAGVEALDALSGSLHELAAAARDAAAAYLDTELRTTATFLDVDPAPAPAPVGGPR
ncbi:type VII secretion target [Pseudonocardia sp. ICBG1293]|uniref:type VII secretion target n=1 Tax=Pseudonocardia sp. ICBG1293 TaxID=2844382 RepID=UPI001CC92D3E|nr:type VII secretion target [Pseudonocardia sp. ICBG1293]